MKIYTYIKIDINSGEVISEKSYNYEGSLALCGGGGASGHLSFPPPDDVYSYPKHANDYYTDWLGKAGVKIDAAVSLGSSPFAGKDATDPAPYLDDAFANAKSAASGASSFNASSSWLTYVENAKGKVSDADYFLSGLIDTVISKAANDVSSQMSSAVTITQNQIESMLTNAFTKATTDLSTFMTTAFAEAHSLANSSEVDTAVNAYDEASRKELFSSYSRLGASMVEIGATNSSAFFMGMAMLERDHVREVNRYRAELMLKSVTEFFNVYAQMFANEIGKYISSGMDIYKALVSTFAMYLQSSDNAKRLAFSGAGQILSGVLSEKQLKGSMSAVESEVGRVRYLAEQQREDKNIDYDVKDSTWVLDFLQSGANILASSGGATTLPGHMSKEQSTISGALSGAMMGAEVTSKSGSPYVIGAGIIVGALAGGYLGNRQ